EDHRLGRVIAGGDRRKIGLGPDLERARACRKNGGCRGRDDAGELVEQPAVPRDDVVVPPPAPPLPVVAPCLPTHSTPPPPRNFKSKNRTGIINLLVWWI